jgi:fermentation-respiration switch protein FrsA (DUF1100 family)
VSELELPRHRIVLYGRSLGTGPTIELSSQEPCGLAGMILQSPLATAISTQCPRCCATSCLSPVDIFTNNTKVGAAQYPTLIIHGTADRVVPCAHGRQLHQLLAKPMTPFWAEGAGHNDIDYLHSDQYYETLRGFIRTVRNAQLGTSHSTEVVVPSNSNARGATTSKKLEEPLTSA